MSTETIRVNMMCECHSCNISSIKNVPAFNVPVFYWGLLLWNVILYLDFQTTTTLLQRHFKSPVGDFGDSDNSATMMPSLLSKFKSSVSDQDVNNSANCNEVIWSGAKLGWDIIQSDFPLLSRCLDLHAGAAGHAELLSRV